MTTILIAVGGAVGAVLRHRIGVSIGVRGMPAATLAVNATGTFLLAALLSGTWAVRLDSASLAGLSTGLLGGFTTYSAFGFETFEFARSGRMLTAASYAVATLLAGLLAAAAGYALARLVA